MTMTERERAKRKTKLAGGRCVCPEARDNQPIRDPHVMRAPDDRKLQWNAAVICRWCGGLIKALRNGRRWNAVDEEIQQGGE